MLSKKWQYFWKNAFPFLESMGDSGLLMYQFCLIGRVSRNHKQVHKIKKVLLHGNHAFAVRRNMFPGYSK